LSLSNPASRDRAATKENIITTQEIARNGDESICHPSDELFLVASFRYSYLGKLSASEVVWGWEQT